ncbi:MAG TPA: hypothetical protein DCE55_16990, partial [Planctomycetaceae bacterium]|nr:hypothetical protein [Planctomycetaceae bacterium]
RISGAIIKIPDSFALTTPETRLQQLLTGKKSADPRSPGPSHRLESGVSAGRQHSGTLVAKPGPATTHVPFAMQSG